MCVCECVCVCVYLKTIVCVCVCFDSLVSVWIRVCVSASKCVGLLLLTQVKISVLRILHGSLLKRVICVCSVMHKTELCLRKKWAMSDIVKREEKSHSSCIARLFCCSFSKSKNDS